MAISIGSNIASLRAQRQLAQSSDVLAKTYEKLSSGLRINTASDDAAGLAIVSQLNSDARVFATAIKNVNDGVSASSIAEGALGALKDISQRQLELAEQAANGTLSLTQRQALNTEANALVDEYNRVVSSTTFNGMNLLDPALGTVLIQAGYGSVSTLQLGLSDQLKHAVGDGTFQAVTAFTTGGTLPDGVTVADLNGDGKLDMISADRTGVDISVFLGNGDGTFQVAKTYLAGGAGTNSAITGDLNGDGKLDIVTADFSGNDLSVFFGVGDGTFQTAQTFQSVGTQPYEVSLGDINGDGKLDMISANSSGNSVTIFLGNGNGTFRTARTFATGGNSPESIKLGDVNGDGKIDLVTADNSGNDVSIFIGTGDGSFLAPKTFHTGGNGPKSVSLGDLNNDGKLDIVSEDSTGKDVSIFIGNGDGSFQAAVTYGTGGVSPISIVLGDLNGDGKLDIVSGELTGNDVSIFIGNGNGTFQAAKTFAGATHVEALTLGDLNSDGRLDIVTANTTTTSLGVFFANGTYASTTPYLNINTQQGARDALGTINANLDRISAQLGAIGATTSKFKIELNNLQAQRENYQAAASRIEDVDVAQESSTLTRTQILQQVAASMLAQANQEPKLALTLLR